MNNLIQYASFLVAVGCTLEYHTDIAQISVREFPEDNNRREAVVGALEDIQKFDETANHQDGMAAFHLCDYVNGEPNPLSKTERVRTLNALKVMIEDKFSFTVMMAARANRSWHNSRTPNSCSEFGDVCTHRGTIINPNKRGIRSQRKPTEYHPQTGTVIKREQLVTPSLEKAYNLIPDRMFTSVKPQTMSMSSLEQQIENLPPDALDDFLKKLIEMKEQRANANH